MNEDAREWGLFILCGLLLAAVLISAWLQVPDPDPVQVMPVTAPSAGPDREITATDPTDYEKIRLNSATAEELVLLPGLGEKTALRIIQYRDAHGGFGSVEELLQVEGIGEKKLEQWRSLLIL